MTDLSEMRRIAEAATPGPWFYEPGLPTGSVWAVHPLTLVASKPNYEAAKWLATFDPPTVLALLDVVEAAERWWLNKRPVGWAQEEHEENEMVNCATDAEKGLALAVAALSRLESL